MKENLDEKARLETLMQSGYRGSSRELMRDQGFPEQIVSRYYMRFLRKYGYLQSRWG